MAIRLDTTPNSGARQTTGQSRGSPGGFPAASWFAAAFAIARAMALVVARRVHNPTIAVMPEGCLDLRSQTPATGVRHPSGGIGCLTAALR